MPRFRHLCECVLIPGVLITCSLAATPSAPFEVANILNQARQLLDKREIGEAKALLTQPQLDTFRKGNPLVDAAVLNDLGLIFYKQGVFRDAEDAYNRAIGLLERAGGGDTLDLIDPLANLANLLYECSQFSRAEKLLTKEIAILNVSASEDRYRRSAVAQAALAKVYLSEHKYELAERTAESLITSGGDTNETLRLCAAVGYSVIASIATQQHRYSAAEPSLRAALSILENTLGSDDPRVSEARANLGLLYAATRDPVKAAPLLEDAYEHLNTSHTNSSFLREFLLSYAEVENRAGHKKKARELFSEAQSLAATSPAASVSRYIVDASAFRQ
jgi:tetratricopeptide (TPR) repeat protein